MISFDQLEQLAANAGFSGNDVPIAAAVALAESSGNPNIIGDRGTSYGLWQIHLPDHPELAGENLLDPVVNAAAAFHVFGKQGWRAWSTYKQNLYVKFLPAQPPADVPLTIDAGTGQPVNTASTSTQEASAMPDVSPDAGGPSVGSVLMWAALGIAALWIFEEAT